MIDMAAAITPKSDQQNADDLIAGPMTITITRVAVSAGEQPVSIFFQGDAGKPWKPCKSMCRVMVAMWGPDATRYVGRSLTLYRDPDVQWGGMKVGGIRVSHMSHIDGPRTMALTATRGARKPYTVRPLEDGPNNPPPPRNDNADQPRAIPLPEDADAAAMKRWGAHLRTMIANASTYGLKVTWSELNADTLLRIADKSPPLAAWIKEPLPADDEESGADLNADDAATWADEPGASSPRPLAPGAASSVTSERNA